MDKQEKGGLAPIIMLKKSIQNRKMILKLAKNDFKTKYAGSYFGIFWAFVPPIVTILLYWFVFQIGFRSEPVGDYPFVLWLTAGLVPWFYFSDAWNGGTASLLEYSYLVKKVVYVSDIHRKRTYTVHSCLAAGVLSDLQHGIDLGAVLFHFCCCGIYSGSGTFTGSFFAGFNVADSDYVEYYHGGEISMAGSINEM